MTVKIESPEVIDQNIKEWNIPIPEHEYMVVVHCSTYNHSKYIEDALKGFVMQQTNFPFCAIIIDDASTDNNAEIIRKYANKYPDIIKPICLGYNHMQHSISRNPYFDCWHQSAKYIAQCEGDDYWEDPYKLQKQVDILESNPEIGLCYSKAHIYIQSSGLRSSQTIGEGKNSPLDEIITKGNFIPTLTTLYRKDLMFRYYEEIKPETKQWKMGDMPMWIWFIINSKIIFLDEITAVYRILSDSASHSRDLKKEETFNKSALNIRLFYINHYPCFKYMENDVWNLYYRSLLDIGEKHNNRLYCLDALSKINKKNKTEKVKKMIYYIPGGIYIYKCLNKFRSLIK